MPDSAAPPLERRLEIVERIVDAVSEHFPHWDLIPEVDFAPLAADYRREARDADSRRRFALVTSAFLARLRNGHTLVRDAYVLRTSGGPLSFSIRSARDGWVVYDSEDPRLPDGSVVRGINGRDIEDFFRDRRDHLSASTERAARHLLFAHGGMETTHLLPRRLELALATRERVLVERTASSVTAGVTGRSRFAVQDRWLIEGEVAYMRIPGFSPYEHRRRAEELVRGRFHDAPALVIDVRGAWGGATPSDLIRALMDRPWRLWAGDTIPPLTTQPVYRGELFIIIDAGCVSACEDFVMPFRFNDRATLIGEATAGSSGQPATLEFDEGLEVWIASRSMTLPDGAPFEAVGVRPHVEMAPTIDAFRDGADPELEKAVELARASISKRRSRR